MSDVSWNCSVEKVPPTGLTVGTLFELGCQGPQVAGLVPTSLGLELAKADRYKLQVLEVKSAGETGFQAVVTGYVPGQINLESAVLTDGLVRIALKGIEFEVQSVLDPADKEPKPFPPEGPVGLMWPRPVLFSILLLVLLIGAGVLFGIRRRRQAHAFREWLEKNQTPLSPIDQLNKELRRIAKDRNPLSQVTEMQRVTREYLARETRAPVLTASPKSIFRKISDGDSKFRQAIGPKTIRLFSEFERLTEGLEKKSIDDKEALSRSLPALMDLVSEYAEQVRSYTARMSASRFRRQP